VKNVAVIILAYNEERHIERAINSVSYFAQEIYVVDSYSRDRTAALAAAAGATVLQHPFVNYARQFQWAIDTVPTACPWLMRLDADEVIEPALAAEIVATLVQLPADVVGVNLKRKHIFMDRWVRHGGRYPLVLLRIWRRGCGRIEDRWMDEHMLVSGGRTVTLRGSFQDHNLNDLAYFIEKHNKYATREAVDVLNQRWSLFARDSGIAGGGGPLQAALKRYVKEGVYNRLPFTIGALSYFAWRYVFQLGFLDGRSGLVYHFLQGYWYRFLVGAKLMELEAALADVQGHEQKLVELERLTGLDLGAGSGKEPQ
jgi:glycosyltransferase involved in cell wall biosynthesis